MAPARTMDEARKYFAGQFEVFIDGGELTSRTGSSVVEIAGETGTADSRRRYRHIGELETAVGPGRIVP
jgi:tRNA A37 threonylcarbamoyladenosine synthetase subunit TsaC/SUA5/YrdC